jgi:hypothetical protein
MTHEKENKYFLPPNPLEKSSKDLAGDECWLKEAAEAEPSLA